MECLGYRVRAGDIELEIHLKAYSKNSSYISKISQSELFYCCGKLIKDALFLRHKRKYIFSILAIKASDCSNQEQWPFALRFVDKVGEIKEKF